MNDGSTRVTQIQIGPIFNTAWRVLSENKALVLIIFAAYIPVIVVDALTDLFSSMYVFWGLFMLASAITTAFSGLVVHAVLQALDGEQPDLKESMARGLAWILPTLIVSVLSTIITLLGMVALVIPGIILACVLAVSIEACVAEGLDPIDSLKRSAELTKGNRVNIFGFSLVLGFLSALIAAGIELLVELFIDPSLTYTFFSYLLCMPVYTYTTVAYIVLYRFLANSGSGGGQERYSKVFN